MGHSVWIVFALTVVIHTAETLSYSIRLAGVRLGKIAIALSLTGIVVLVSRTANLVQAPLTAKLVDTARVQPGFPLENYLRIILLGGSLGTLLAIGLFPTCAVLFGRIISRLEIEGSIPRLLASVTVGQLKNTRKYVRRPRMKLYRMRYLDVPKRLIVLNMFVTGFYTVGVMSSLYAAHRVPEFSTTASQASGIINGLATILLTLFIDPQLGLITDKALRSPEDQGKLAKVYVMLMGSRFVGTLMAQLFLVPGAALIALVVRHI